MKNMKGLVSVMETRDLGELLDWRDSIWLRSKEQRRYKKLGYNASLYTAEFSLDENGNLEISGGYDAEKVNGIYVHTLDHSFVDEEFDIEEFIETFEELLT